MIHPWEIGNRVDEITGNKRRNPKRVFLRALEEMAELGLEFGVTQAEMFSAISDSVHNQCLKISESSGATVFPSQLELTYDVQRVIKEMADVKLVMLDLCYVTQIETWRVNNQVKEKYLKLIKTPLSNFTSDGNTFYLKKPHIK